MDEADNRPMDLEELFGLSKNRFMDHVTEYIKVFCDGKPVKISDPQECPVHLYMLVNNAKCKAQMVPNIAYCPFCGAAMCPDCWNHCCEQLSRVTGYLSSVSNWNEGKKEELRNRYKYDGKTLNGVKV